MASSPVENYADHNSSGSSGSRNCLLNSLLTLDETSATTNTALHNNENYSSLCYNSTAVSSVNDDNPINTNVRKDDEEGDNNDTATAKPLVVRDVEGTLLCYKLQYNNINNNINNDNNYNHHHDDFELKNTETLINHNRMDDNSNDSSSGHEKSDAPEKINKFENDVTQNSVTANKDFMNDSLKTTKTVATDAAVMLTTGSTAESERFAAIDVSTEADTKTPDVAPGSDADNVLKQSYAFTIDCANGENQLDAETKAAKYKSMLERFQNRHKRVASMNACPIDITQNNHTINNNKSNIMKKSNTQQLNAENYEFLGMPRARSVQRTTKDFATKRRSWSPRAFEYATRDTTSVYQEQQQQQQQRMNKLQLQQQLQSRAHKQKPSSNKLSTTTKTTTTKPATSSSSSVISGNRTDDDQYKDQKRYFQPRSTVMQMAMKKVDYVCTKPLLDDFQCFELKNNDNEADKISETGTYTLEGDTYTEEQKEYMNIDKNLRKLQHKIANLKSSQQYQQHHFDNTVDDEDDNSDIGFVTSVTTSGVLSKSNHSSSPRSQPMQQHKSMYGCVARKTSAVNCLDMLNMAENNKANSISSSNNFMENSSDIAILKTAQTRKDWVQEWARNARARSLANDYVSNTTDVYDDVQQSQQSQIITSPTTSSLSVAGTTIISKKQRHYTKSSRPQQQILMSQSLNNSGEYGNHNNNNNNSHDALIQRLYYNKKCNNNADVSWCSETSSTKSLRSPTSTASAAGVTKIPSPLHTNRRAKSSTRINADTNKIFDGDTIEHIFEQHATNSNIKLINNSKLQRSDLVCTQLPQRQQQQKHLSQKDNLFNKNSLMTSSYNEKRQHHAKHEAHEFDNEHDILSFRVRKNSCDGNIEYRQKRQQQQQRLSPLHKSKIKGTKTVTASTSRGLNMTSNAPKSICNNFRKIYNYFNTDNYDHDNDIEYYVEDIDDEISCDISTAGQLEQKVEINNHAVEGDVDDDNDEIYIEEETLSGDPVVMSHYKFKFVTQELALPSSATSIASTSNARYNKTLLMRIQNSKQQRAAANQDNGIAACPNTPELPRRGIININNNNKTIAMRSRGGLGGRMSEPRDNSVCRRNESLQVPKSLDMAKKHLLQTAASCRAQSAGVVNTSQVQPKYLNISRFQSPQSKQFLRKNESRSTLKPATSFTSTSNLTTNNNNNLGAMKRSPSASGGLCRNDSTRTSKGSVRGGVPSCMTSSGTTLSGNAHGLAGFNNLHQNTNSYTSTATGLVATRSPASRFDSYPTKQKEAEMAMWKRRSTYDPMRAAAEDRRRKEELKRQTLARM